MGSLSFKSASPPVAALASMLAINFEVRNSRFLSETERACCRHQAKDCIRRIRSAILNEEKARSSESVFDAYEQTERTAYLMELSA